MLERSAVRRVSSLLRQKSSSVCFHLFQTLYQMVVGHFHLFDLVQGCTELQKWTRGWDESVTELKTVKGFQSLWFMVEVIVWTTGSIHTSLWSFLFSAFSSSSTFSELSAAALYLDTCPSSLLTCQTQTKQFSFKKKTVKWILTVCKMKPMKSTDLNKLTFCSIVAISCSAFEILNLYSLICLLASPTENKDGC